jgi:tetratricopeptide (TPR) repeat protein
MTTPPDFRWPANSLDVEADRATLRAVRSVARGGDMKRAAVMAEEALKTGLEHAFLLTMSAIGLENEGRLPDALVRLLRAAELAPLDIGVLNALGLCLHRLDRPIEALERFDAVLKIDPTLAVAHANRGGALFARGLLDEAEASYREALALDPNLVAATAGLASIATRRGAHGVARPLAEKVLQAVPNFPEAVMSVAAAELATGSSGESEALLRRLLSDPQLSLFNLAYATGLLGDVLDAQNRPAEAFEAYTASNVHQQRLYADSFAGGQSALEYVELMNGYFETARPDAWAARSAPRTDSCAVLQHVFLVGFPRSGTNLLEVVLESHPQVQTLEEQECLIDGVRSFMRDAADLQRLSQAPESELQPLRDAYWRRATQKGPMVAGKVFVDRYALNTLKLPLIARLFPSAKIVFARRDPRDVVLSCFRHRFHMSYPMYQMLTLVGAAAFYDAVMRLAVRLDTLFALQTLYVRHESLVENFESETRSVCTFLGLTWTQALGDFSALTQERAVATSSTLQLDRDLRIDGLGQWRRYRAQMQPVLAMLEPWVERFGYSR